MATLDQKKKAILNLIKYQPDIDKIYLYANNPCKAKHQLLINKCEGVGLRHCNDQNTFIEYFNKMDDVYKNNEECNPGKGQKLLIVFDDMIADMNSAKKLHPIVRELFIGFHYPIILCSAKKY